MSMANEGSTETNSAEPQTTPAATGKPIDNGRAANGQFTAGNTASKCTKSPAAMQKRELADSFRAAVTPRDIKDIAEKMVTLAKNGDVKAAQIVLDRCCGKPPQALNIGDANGEPLPPITVIIQHGEAQS